MGFNEKTHAFLAAKFYVYLKEEFAERGTASFVHAVQYYAGQRGRRMAQRAIRDGKPLTHAVFMQYGELVTTDEVEPADGDLISLSPDYELHITTCPWFEQFRDMDCREAGSVYCTYLDEALSRGFNPAIVFEAPTNLNTSDYCLHRVRNVNYTEFPNDPPKNEYKKDFRYHCANTYFAFREVICAIFGAEGEAVCEHVLRDFSDTYGVEMAEELLRWKDTNFNIC